MNQYTAFLRVRHPSIDPGEITRVLGIEPAHAWAAGSPRGGAETARSAHTESYWFAPLGERLWPSWTSSTMPAAPFEAFLLAQIRLLTPHKGFFARLGTDGGTCELAVTLSAGDRIGIELPAPLLRSLADLGMAITLEITTGDEPVSH
jgi:hypothetical protein